MRYMRYALLALLALVALIVAADSPQATRAVYLVSDPVAGSVASVDVDMDTTGNGPSVVGPQGIQLAIGNIPLATPYDIDIVADEIHAADGSPAFSLNILYDPTVIKITARDFSFNFADAVELSQPPPDTDGDYRMDVFTIPPTLGVSGEIILVRVTVECVASGISPINVEDLVGGDGIPDVYAANTSLLSVGAAGDGVIACNRPAPPPTDIEVTSVTTSAPANGVEGTPFTVTADVSVSNNGPVDPITVDTAIELNLPTGCSTGDANPVTVQGTSVSVAASPLLMGPPTPSASWSVTCSDPSLYSFTTTATASIDDLSSGYDSIPANNTISSSASSTTIAADSDGDGVPDGLDLCPGTAPATPVDVNGCSDSQVDQDGDGICDPGALSGGPSGCTGVDNCPEVANPGQENTDGDQWADACEAVNCIAVATVWETPFGDTDCDGFTTADEGFMGTDFNDACAANNVAGNEGLPDAWPFDFNDNQRADLSDVLGFIPVFNSFFPIAPYDPRFDLDASGGITLGDVLSFIPVFNLTCGP